MVGAVPAELMAQATGESAAAAEPAEWLAVFDDFVRTKKQCGEPTDGLTFEKFAQTLKKNRDALIERHGCKRVKFSVYVKEGALAQGDPVKGVRSLHEHVSHERSSQRHHHRLRPRRAHRGHLRRARQPQAAHVRGPRRGAASPAGSS